MVGITSIKKCVAVLLVCFMSAHSVLASLSESNFWTERHKTVAPRSQNKTPQYASLPRTLPDTSAVINQLPSVGTALNKINRWSDSNKIQGLKLSRPIKNLADAIPLTDAAIQDVYDSGNTSVAPVVLIQDIHLNPEAQFHEARVLQQLIDRQLINLVGVEGAFRPFDFTQLRSFPDKKITKDIGDSFLKKNLLAAPSYVGLTSGIEPPAFVGVDDVDHYRKNVDAYMSTIKQKEIAIKKLNAQRLKLGQTTAQIFSPQLKAFDRVRTDYHQSTIGIGPYAKQLASYGIEKDFSVEQFLEAYDLELTLDFKRADQERRVVLEQLAKVLSEKELSGLVAQSLAYRMGQIGFGDYYRTLKTLCEANGVSFRRSPAFDSYIQYVLLSDGINAEKLLSSISTLERRVGRQLIRNKTEQQLSNRSELLVLEEKLVNFSLTPVEWTTYQELKASVGSDLSLVPFENFYLEANFRSKAMLDNLFLARHSTYKHPSAFVVGGFHTPEIAEHLRNKKISYLIVSPKMSKVDDSGSSYLSIFAREKLSLDQTFKGEKLFINPSNVAGVPDLITAPERTRMLVAEELARQPVNPIPTATVQGHGNTRAVRDGSMGIYATVNVSAEPGDVVLHPPYLVGLLGETNFLTLMARLDSSIHSIMTSLLNLLRPTRLQKKFLSLVVALTLRLSTIWAAENPVQQDAVNQFRLTDKNSFISEHVALIQTGKQSIEIVDLSHPNKQGNYYFFEKKIKSARIFIERYVVLIYEDSTIEILKLHPDVGELSSSSGSMRISATSNSILDAAFARRLLSDDFALNELSAQTLKGHLKRDSGPTIAAREILLSILGADVTQIDAVPDLDYLKALNSMLADPMLPNKLNTENLNLPVDALEPLRKILSGGTIDLKTHRLVNRILLEAIFARTFYQYYSLFVTAREVMPIDPQDPTASRRANLVLQIFDVTEGALWKPIPTFEFKEPVPINDTTVPNFGRVEPNADGTQYVNYGPSGTFFLGSAYSGNNYSFLEGSASGPSEAFKYGEDFYLATNCDPSDSQSAASVRAYRGFLLRAQTQIPGLKVVTSLMVAGHKSGSILYAAGLGSQANGKLTIMEAAPALTPLSTIDLNFTVRKMNIGPDGFLYALGDITDDNGTRVILGKINVNDPSHPVIEVIDPNTSNSTILEKNAVEKALRSPSQDWFTYVTQSIPKKIVTVAQSRPVGQAFPLKGQTNPNVVPQFIPGDEFYSDLSMSDESDVLVVMHRSGEAAQLLLEGQLLPGNKFIAPHIKVALFFTRPDGAHIARVTYADKLDQGGRMIDPHTVDIAFGMNLVQPRANPQHETSPAGLAPSKSATSSGSGRRVIQSDLEQRRIRSTPQPLGEQGGGKRVGGISYLVHRLFFSQLSESAYADAAWKLENNILLRWIVAPVLVVQLLLWSVFGIQFDLTLSVDIAMTLFAMVHIPWLVRRANDRSPTWNFVVASLLSGGMIFVSHMGAIGNPWIDVLMLITLGAMFYPMHWAVNKIFKRMSGASQTAKVHQALNTTLLAVQNAPDPLSAIFAAQSLHSLGISNWTGPRIVQEMATLQGNSALDQTAVNQTASREKSTDTLAQENIAFAIGALLAESSIDPKLPYRFVLLSEQAPDLRRVEASLAVAAFENRPIRLVVPQRDQNLYEKAVKAVREFYPQLKAEMTILDDSHFIMKAARAGRSMTVAEIETNLGWPTEKSFIIYDGFNLAAETELTMKFISFMPEIKTLLNETYFKRIWEAIATAA